MFPGKKQNTKQLFYEMPSDSEDSFEWSSLKPGKGSSKPKGKKEERAPKEKKKEKAPVIRKLPPPDSDDDSEAQFQGSL